MGIKDCYREAPNLPGSPGAQGTSEVFVELWHLYRNDLYALCLSLMGGRHADAEEAFSNAWIVAFSKYRKLGETVRDPKAWLYRLFRNACIDAYRKRKRQREWGLDDLEGLELAEGRLIEAVDKSPQQCYLERELHLFLRQAVLALPERLREPMVLRFFGQMSYQEIGRLLRISEENARKRVQQARLSVKERLASYFAGGPGLIEEILEPSALPAPSHALNAAVTGPEPPIGELGPRPVALRAVELAVGRGQVQSVLVYLAERPKRDPASKLPALTRYIAQHPTGWKKRREMADLLYLLGRWEEAATQYGQVVEKQPYRIEAWLRLGEILSRLQREEEAAAAYAGALERARSAGTAHHLRGRIALCRHDRTAAIGSFEEAALAEPCEPAHRVALGSFHLAADRPLEAVAAFDRALAADPRDLSALTLGHEALRASGRAAEARRRVLWSIELDAANFVAAKRLAEARCRQRLTEGEEGRKTSSLVRSVLRLARGWPDGREALFFYHAARGRLAAALAALASFVEEHRDNGRGWALYACGLARTGDAAAAAVAVLRSLALDPSDRETYRMACRILPRAGFLAEVGRLRGEMLERFPESWCCWAAAAVSRVDSQESEWARHAARQVVQLQPHLAAAWLARGEILLACHDDEEAASAFETAWRLLPEGGESPQQPAVALGLAEACRRLGLIERAAECSRRALETLGGPDIDLALCHFLRARAWAGLGDGERAQRDVHAALRHHLFAPMKDAPQHAARWAARADPNASPSRLPLAWWAD
jgi:RNA polymerase sigma factor (sigma-70 family)